MAAQNDNQGLKIAVACFVMLSVILAVTTYFGFSYYSQTEARLKTTEGERDAEKKTATDYLRLATTVKEKAGYPKAESDDIVKAMDKDLDELSKKITAVAEDSRKTIESYKGDGGNLGKLDELKQSLDAIIAGGVTPGPPSLQATMFRLQELLANQAAIATSMALEFHNTRKQLEAVNQVNKAQMDVEVGANQKSKEDLNAEHTKHETERAALMSKLDALQSDLNKMAGDNQKLKNQITQIEDDTRKQREDLLTQVRYFRNIVEKKDTVLDKKDGTLTSVNYRENLVTTDINRRQGARERMVFTIFDKKAAGIPADKPKGTIELIRVTDTGSIGRIIQTTKSIEPLRTGDLVYSPVWDHDRPLQYALIGKIDINRDGRDDRADLKQMIEAAGGVVAYDLPPPGVGVESGKLTPLIAWYVIDEREAFHPTTEHESKQVLGDADEAFFKKRTEAIRTAALDGIRPISIERLLAQLGYTYGTPVAGKVEAIDRPGVNVITNPKGRVGVLPTPEATDEKKAEPEKTEPEKKNDADKEEPK